MTKDMYTRTLDLLKGDGGTIAEIAAGADVNVHWLAKFRQEKFENPGVKTIERLHNYLAQRALAREQEGKQARAVTRMAG